MIDNIFINKLKNVNYSVYFLINGLSDHDAQVLSLSDIMVPDNRDELYSYHEISTHSLHEFWTNLSYEAWENVFNDNDTDTAFNNFLNTFLRIFNASFLKKSTKLRQNSKAWLTTGIKTSCNNKRKIYLLYRESTNDPNLKIYYKNYCKTLSKVIILAKQMYYNNLLANSTNKPKTTWSIIKTITNTKKNHNDIIRMEIDGKITTYHQTIAEEFNF
jgi:hypothetical protein